MPTVSDHLAAAHAAERESRALPTTAYGAHNAAMAQLHALYAIVDLLTAMMPAAAGPTQQPAEPTGDAVPTFDIPEPVATERNGGPA